MVIVSACALSIGRHNGGGAINTPTAATGGAGAGAGAQQAAIPHAQRNYGPRAYGPGLRNPYAFPPNPFVMQRALHVANMNKNLLVVSVVYSIYLSNNKN